MLNLVMVALLGFKTQFIWPFAEEVILQLVPSTVTVLFLRLSENPFPFIVRYCPPIFPADGETEVIVGSAENSNDSFRTKEDLLR